MINFFQKYSHALLWAFIISMIAINYSQWQARKIDKLERDNLAQKFNTLQSNFTTLTGAVSDIANTLKAYNERAEQQLAKESAAQQRGSENKEASRNDLQQARVDSVLIPDPVIKRLQSAAAAARTASAIADNSDTSQSNAALSGSGDTREN